MIRLFWLLNNSNILSAYSHEDDEVKAEDKSW